MVGRKSYCHSSCRKKPLSNWMKLSGTPKHSKRKRKIKSVGRMQRVLIAPTKASALNEQHLCSVILQIGEERRKRGSYGSLAGWLWPRTFMLLASCINLMPQRNVIGPGLQVVTVEVMALRTAKQSCRVEMVGKTLGYLFVEK